MLASKETVVWLANCLFVTNVWVVISWWFLFLKSKRLTENVIDSEMHRDADGDLRVRVLVWMLDVCAVKCLGKRRSLNMTCSGLSHEACLWVSLKIHALLQIGYSFRKVNTWNFNHYWAWIHGEDLLFIFSWSESCFLDFLKTIGLPISFGLHSCSFTVCLIFPRCPLFLIHVCFRFCFP